MDQKISVVMGCGTPRTFVLKGEDHSFTLSYEHAVTDKDSPNFGTTVLKTIGYHGHLKSAYLSLLRNAQINTCGGFAEVIATSDAVEAAILEALGRAKAARPKAALPKATQAAEARAVSLSELPAMSDDVFDFGDD